MNKERVIFGIAGAVVGGAVGFFAGYKLLENKVRKDHDEKLKREVEQLRTMQDIPEENDISEDENSEKKEKEVQEFSEIIDDLQYGFEDEEESEEEAVSDIYDEEFEVKINEKHRNPKVLGKTQMDPDDPDLKYDSEELFYFMDDGVLTDSDGHHMDETDTIGNSLRRYGFMQGGGDLDSVWVRNYDFEVDYEVHREVGSSSEMFGEE